MRSLRSVDARSRRPPSRKLITPVSRDGQALGGDDDQGTGRAANLFFKPFSGATAKVKKALWTRILDWATYFPHPQSGASDEDQYPELVVAVKTAKSILKVCCLFRVSK